MKRIDVLSVGFAMSDRLLIGGFVELIALTDGHVFRLCDYPDAPIVICNPLNNEAISLLTKPKPGIAYIQYGIPEFSSDPSVWRLGLPLRLAPLREIMIAIVAQRSQWQREGLLAPEAPSPNLAALPVSAHRRLEHVLRMLQSIIQSHVPHSFTGIKGVKILVLPLLNAVYIQCEPGIVSWQLALANTSHRVGIFPRPDAQALPEFSAISVAHFYWELARQLSAGMLLPGLASRQEFALSRWPDFGTFGAASAFDLRVVALIATRSSSIAGILKIVPYTLEGIIGLLNACALVGCMRNTPEDLLSSSETRQVALSGPVVRTMPAPIHPSSTPFNPVPQRGFLGMLNKLRAALSFVPRANS